MTMIAEAARVALRRMNGSSAERIDFYIQQQQRAGTVGAATVEGIDTAWLARRAIVREDQAQLREQFKRAQS